MKPNSNPPQSGSHAPDMSKEERQRRVHQFAAGLTSKDREILTEYLYIDQSNPLAMLKHMRQQHGHRFDELAYAIHQITEECRMPTDDVHALIKDELDQPELMTLEDVNTEQTAVASVRVAVTDVTNQGVDPFGLTHISSNPPPSSPLPPVSPRPAEVAPSVAYPTEVLLKSYLLEVLDDELRAVVYSDVTVVEQRELMNRATTVLLQRLQEGGYSYEDAKRAIAAIISLRKK